VKAAAGFIPGEKMSTEMNITGKKPMIFPAGSSGSGETVNRTGKINRFPFSRLQDNLKK
jgi:hypothetical protein